MQPGDTIDLDITGVAHGGVFVARHEGRVVFVTDAIPGERVRARLSDTKASSFWRAQTVEVLEASPHRIDHVWPAAGLEVDPDHRAGGAEFGHIALPHQRVLKEQVLREALERMAGVTDRPITVAPAGDDSGDATRTESADGTRWRTRVSVHVDEQGRIGAFAARSHRVIETPDLPLATLAIEEAVAGLRGSAKGAAPGRIDIVQPADGRVRVIPRPERARPAPRAPRGVKRPAAPQSPARRGANPARERIVERAGSRDFTLDAGGFWQVHRLAAETLRGAVGRAIEATGGLDPEASHLDLYGGVGLFAASLIDHGGVHVTTVESDARASEYAGANLADHLGVRAVAERADRFLARTLSEHSAAERDRARRGVVVLDPPRSGAGAGVVAQLVERAPASLVYVACDPVALARDVRLFADAGYTLTHLEAFDLFPHSHHLEAVAVLARG